MKRHDHIQAALMFNIMQKLEELQRRGIGFIDKSYYGGVDYRIDDTVYEISISERPTEEDNDG